MANAAITEVDGVFKSKVYMLLEVQKVQGNSEPKKGRASEYEAGILTTQ